MDRLELALRQYQEIVPQAVANRDLPSKKIEVWLSEDVCPVLGDYSRRPTFREYASRPIRVLQASAPSTERALIDAVDRSLVDCAKAVAKLADLKRVTRQVHELFSPRPHVTADSIEISAAGKSVRAEKRELVDDGGMELSQLRAIAERDWTDLVNVDDYLQPQQEWAQARDKKYLQRADWIVSLNPELLPVGNFVVRCLWKRIGMRVDCIEAISRRYLMALQRLGSDHQKHREAIDANWRTLQDNVKAVEIALRMGEDVQLSDACIVATQVYAACHPAPDISWLGLDDTIVENGRAAIQARLRGWRRVEMLNRIAAALSELRFLNRDGDPDQSAVEAAISTGGLVIVEHSREVYWQNKPLGKTWHKVPWRLLLGLARKARYRAAVEQRDVFEDARADTAMSTTWDRLKQKLPPSLTKLVTPGQEKQTYRLDLEPHRIHIFP